MDAKLVFLGLLIPLTLFVGGFVIAGMALTRRTRLRELLYRERIARIERGLPLGSDTDVFEEERSTMGVMSSLDYVGASRVQRRRSAGVILIALGSALGLLIGVAGGEAGAAIGVGGAVMMLGLAFVVNAWLDARQPLPPRPSPTAGGRPTGAPSIPPDLTP